MILTTVVLSLKFQAAQVVNESGCERGIIPEEILDILERDARITKFAKDILEGNVHEISEKIFPSYTFYWNYRLNIFILRVEMIFVVIALGFREFVINDWRIYDRTTLITRIRPGLWFHLFKPGMKISCKQCKCFRVGTMGFGTCDNYPYNYCKPIWHD